VSIFSLPKDVAYMSQKQEVSNSTPYYSQTTTASQFSSDENFLKQARVVTLGEMKKLKQVSQIHFLIIQHEKLKWIF
jgi:uncharacterized membrane protein YjjP (DUF1212 family)